MTPSRPVYPFSCNRTGTFCAVKRLSQSQSSSMSVTSSQLVAEAQLPVNTGSCERAIVYCAMLKDECAHTKLNRSHRPATMKLQLLLLAAVCVIVLVDGISAENVIKQRKYKKVGGRRRPSSSTSTTETEAVASGEDMFAMMDSDEKASKVLEPVLEEVDVKENEIPFNDPCASKHCGAGRVCDVNGNGEAECVCVPECPAEVDPRRKVCSNHNETWDSDCDVYRMRCVCDRGQEACRDDKFKHVHIEYYGACRDMPECSEAEMMDFPRRMRDWLFNIMRDLADRHELSPHYLKMEREAETNMTRRWSNAAVWKWCDLDGHPHDRTVSRHELFPIRAPLMSLEHCIAPFFDSCDADDDHRISLQEWGKCLQIDEAELDDRCEELRQLEG